MWNLYIWIAKGILGYTNKYINHWLLALETCLIFQKRNIFLFRAVLKKCSYYVRTQLLFDFLEVFFHKKSIKRLLHCPDWSLNTPMTSSLFPIVRLTFVLMTNQFLFLCLFWWLAGLFWWLACLFWCLVNILTEGLVFTIMTLYFYLLTLMSTFWCFLHFQILINTCKTYSS